MEKAKFSKTIMEVFKSQRLKLGLRQEDVVEKVNDLLKKENSRKNSFSRMKISRCKNEKEELSLKVFLAICIVLDLNVNDVIYNDIFKNIFYNDDDLEKYRFLFNKPKGLFIIDNPVETSDQIGTKIQNFFKNKTIKQNEMISNSDNFQYDYFGEIIYQISESKLSKCKNKKKFSIDFLIIFLFTIKLTLDDLYKKY